MEPDRSCQCVKTCGVCIRCPNEMDAEDLLCPDCRDGNCPCHHALVKIKAFLDEPTVP